MKYDHSTSNPQCSAEEFIEALNKSGKPFSVVAPRIFSYLLPNEGIKVLFLSDPRREKRKKSFMGFVETQEKNIYNFNYEDLKAVSVYDTSCIHLQTIKRKEKIPYSVSSTSSQLNFSGLSYYIVPVFYSRLLIKDTVYVVNTDDLALYTLPNRNIY